MDMMTSRIALVFDITFSLRTPLLLRTGDGDDVSDNTIDKTPDNNLHVNGYVWASLLRRAFSRLKKGAELTCDIGKYDAAERGVSCLWCESSIETLPDSDYRYGIQVHRKWGATTTGAMFTEENVPAGLILHMKGIWFIPKNQNILDPAGDYRQILTQALWVINQGIENIGGGWSYGFGRLEFISGECWNLDLMRPAHRQTLFPAGAKRPEGLAVATLNLPVDMPAIARSWKTYWLEFQIVPGQLMAVHTRYPLIERSDLPDEMPDTFVYQRRHWNHEEKKIEPQFVIPGKAIRQALFSTQIERHLRTEGQDICNGEKKDCICLRCKWFGSTQQGGILAVLDAPIIKSQTDILHRIQLCEHSQQNINLFSGEYLKQGHFTTTVIIDEAIADANPSQAVSYLEFLLNELIPGNAPPGWHRIGATSTCTGQLQLNPIEGPFTNGGCHA